MENIEHYIAISDQAKIIVKLEKAKNKISTKRLEMDFASSTSKARANVSDRLVSACFEVDKARDMMHKLVVDASLAEPRDVETYETQSLTQSHGHGHSYTFNYTPPLPNCYK